MNGLHLIGDLTGCRCDPQLLLDGERFRAKCLEMVAAAGLTTMDASFHTFEGGGFTGTVVLAESHLAIHTWPERQGLTLDVYVCNYSADNSAKARKLFEQMVELLPAHGGRAPRGRPRRAPADGAAQRLDRLLHQGHQAGWASGRRASRRWRSTTRRTIGKLFRLDGFNMTSEKEEFVYHENLIHPALTAHAAPKKVLIIGGGDGGSVRGGAQASLGRAGDDGGDRRRRDRGREGALPRRPSGRLRQPEAAGARRRRDEVRRARPHESST